MSPWNTIWALVFAAGLTGFAVLAVYVTIGGAGDVREMLRRIGAGHRRPARHKHSSRRKRSG